MGEGKLYQTTSVWDKWSEALQCAADTFADEYKEFLTKGKTERECADLAREMLRGAGFREITNGVPAAGEKVFRVWRNKVVFAAKLATDLSDKKVRILGAHIDAPRLDLKQVPLYEDQGMAFLDTHYYGGIKKYQWVTVPLAVHGVVIRGDGSRVSVCIGEDPADPVLTITDLLPHLAKDQMSKVATEVITGEGLNALCGSKPAENGKDGEKVRQQVMNILAEKYLLDEEDLISAELELVPAGPARDVGFDRSMVGGYGQDDRACAFAALKALIDAPEQGPTQIIALFDKEEIGSMGNTGASSRVFEYFLADIAQAYGISGGTSEFRSFLTDAKMLSCDVGAAFDPNFADVNEKKNSSYLGRGLTLVKFTGVRGKYDGSDASAEFLGEVRQLLNKNDIVWHYGEMGKVDQGGGGTVAQFAAALGMEVLDCGVPVLSIHAPFEVSSKADLYTNFLACKAFLIG